MNKPGQQSAFTLIEMIVVMTLLTMVLSIAGPSLSNFFKGRALEEESRRFLALTRFARDEAITRAVPMELWMDSLTGHYGLQVRTGYAGDDDNRKPIEFIMSDSLTFDFGNQKTIQKGLALIRFLPSGMADEQSILEVILRDSKDEYLRIVLDENMYEYKILQINDYDRIR